MNATEFTERVERATAKYGKPVVCIPNGGAASGRVAEVDVGKEGKLRALVIGEQLAHLIALPEQARGLLGKDVDITNDHGRLIVRERTREHVQELGR